VGCFNAGVTGLAGSRLLGLIVLGEKRGEQ